MEAIVEQLIAVVSKEIDAFNQLLTTLHEKQRAIVEGEIERLNVSVEEESAIAITAKNLEAERIRSSNRLARKLSMGNLNPKLSEIIENVEQKYAQRLREQRDLLRSLIQKVRTLNENNQFLLNYSLNFIEKSMEILLTGGDPLKIYKPDGQVRTDIHKRKALDHSV